MDNLRINSLIKLSMCMLGLIIFGYAFYERYWRWRDCFNELGRCYDSNTGVMVEQAGFIWGSLATICFVMFFLNIYRLLKREIG